VKFASAPVVLLAYNRPVHTRRVLQVIRKAEPRVLIAVMDGPRQGDHIDRALVEQTRSVVEEVDWACEFHRVYADSNMGLKNRVSSGLDKAFELVDEAIVLEDDCVPSLSFFGYVSELLHRYRDDERIGIISGTQRLRGRWGGDSSYLFSKDVRIWGWGTWARTWRAFSASGDLGMAWTTDEALEQGESFAAGARRRSMIAMMSRAKELDSWALPFALHCVRKGYLNPIPRKNLIRNIGLGAGATHTGFENYVVDIKGSEIALPLVHPREVAYSFPVDEWESRLDAREFFTYPMKHPLDTLLRVWRWAFTRRDD